MTSIKGLSKSAVVRNRVRTRFKEAVRLALTGTEPGMSVDEGSPKSLLIPGKKTKRFYSRSHDCLQIP